MGIVRRNPCAIASRGRRFGTACLVTGGVVAVVALSAPGASAQFGAAADCKDPTADCFPSGQVGITLSQTTPGTCRFDVTYDWGDGHRQKVTYTTSAQISHTYTSPGIYHLVSNGKGTPLVPGVTCNFPPAEHRVEVPTPAGSPAATTPAPFTLIDQHPRKTITTRSGRARVKFVFDASGYFTAFQCKLDRQKFRSCRSPKSYRVKPGKHTFSARGIGPGGTDQTPASFRFKVVRKR